MMTIDNPGTTTGKRIYSHNQRNNLLSISNRIIELNSRIADHRYLNSNGSISNEQLSRQEYSLINEIDNLTKQLSS
jgi:hypothetical protein